MSPPLKKAVFLDRDGTINQEVGYISRPEQVRLLPGAAGAIADLRQAGFAVVVISNQSGLARGYFTEDDLAAVQAEVERQLLAHGAPLDGFYYCPHLPEGAVEHLAVVCDCRKPATGLVRRAANDLGLSLRGSYMVGDRLRDVACGRAGGLTSILVQSGHQDWPPRGPQEEPHFVAPDLASAAKWILARAAAEGGAA